MAHRFSCDACAFEISSDHDDEVIRHVQQHADEQHDMKMSESDIRGGIKDV